VVSQALGVPLEAALLLVGLLSVFYTTLGGIVADIWSDALQLVLLWGGTLVSAAFVLEEHGAAVLHAIPAERTRALVADSAGLAQGGDFALWPMLFGGLFLYVSYHGCDQSQAQRLLASRDDRSARRALVLNGLLRFPLVLTYCAFGLLLAGLLRVDPAFAAAMQGQPADSLVPVFMMGYLPAGLRGLLLAAILAAAMSSIDSALNSLAAVTLEDVFERPSATQRVWLSRGVLLLWGCSRWPRVWPSPAAARGCWSWSTRWAPPSTGRCWPCSCSAPWRPRSRDATRSPASASASSPTWPSPAPHPRSRGCGGTPPASWRRSSPPWPCPARRWRCAGPPGLAARPRCSRAPSS
jgi:hypothetical protein